MKRLLILILLLFVFVVGFENEPDAVAAPIKNLRNKSDVFLTLASSENPKPVEQGENHDAQTDIYVKQESTYIDLLRTRGALISLNNHGHVISVNLSVTEIMDSDLKGLASFKYLNELFLECTNITDDAVQYLKELVNLKSLNVNTTGITEMGIAELRNILPQCKISHTKVTLSKEAKRNFQFMLISRAIWKFRFDFNRSPSTDLGLGELQVMPSNLKSPNKWRGPYLSNKLGVDPWGKPYNYENVYNSQTGYRIWSAGADRLDDTDDDVIVTSYRQWNLITHSRTVAQLQLRYLAQACERYRADMGEYPTARSGLLALEMAGDMQERWRGPYVDKMIRTDPWGSAYAYAPQQLDNRGPTFVLRSAGADRELGTADDLKQLPISNYMSELHLAMDQRDASRVYVLGANTAYLSNYLIDQTLREIIYLHKACAIFKIVNGYSPTGFDSLDYIPEEKLAKKWSAKTSVGPTDPWGRPYSFFKDEYGISLGSSGPDVSYGTEDDLSMLGWTNFILLTGGEISEGDKLDALGADPQYVKRAKELKSNSNELGNPHANVSWQPTPTPKTPNPRDEPKKNDGPDEKYIKFAVSQIAKYDENKNGMLDGGEIAIGTQKSSMIKASADSNGDGKITPTELATALSKR